ncbi:hypothetical protein [Streptomyces sp. 8L]|uniref:hypothetical protein n=1 Tax=Streptomyces sp. 8L TaxID=2877242 RepID=UPI001CD59437|nr:hypothetical protein [Streptomyces sp. 8L]MCA1224314.1 hypothetical protein [Streptomyces sp. 8L]
MARDPRTQHHHDNLIAATAFLRDQDKPELAGSIDYVLGPDGPAFLKDLANPSGMKVPLTISMRDSRVRIMKDQTSPVERDRILNAGFEAFLAGEFDLRKEKEDRTPLTASGDVRRVLTTNPDADLQARVSQRCRDLKEAGKATVPRLSLGTVAAAVLYQHFGLGPYASDDGA